MRLYFHFLIVLILSLFYEAKAGEAVGPCGSAFVDALQSGPGTITITLTVSLKGQFAPPLIQVGAAGYWFNKNTGAVGAISTPGNNPVYFRDVGLYIDQWIVTPRSGIVEIGVPLIEAIHFGGICFGLFPRATVTVSDSVDPIVLLPETSVALQKKNADDLAFVIDTTGSMSDDIAAVKSSATEIINTLAENSADYRVALVQYNDPSAGVVQGFTSDTATITAAINSLGASGGGDIPEHVYGGLQAALKLPWRLEATRTIITMGDAPPKDPEPGTGLTQAKVVALANSLDISVDTSPTVRQLLRLLSERMPAPVTINIPFNGFVPLFMVPIGGSSTTQASFSSLASMTNGSVFPAASASDVVAALEKAIIEGTSGSASGVKVVERLVLTSICWETSNSHRMRVRNPNDFDVPYSWDVYRTSKKGEGTAKQGDNLFVIEGISRKSTVRLFWKDENNVQKQTQKAINEKNC
ncbi:hypothetical protein FGB62_343g04 [Gracilaria domingensis]|nr:hypothetical protein FGB62_343g04 [Gracilaria domingensis]